MSAIIGRYRPVYPRLWRHPDFGELTKSARELALYLLTGPQTNRIGLFHLSVATAAEDLSASPETIRKGLADITAAFGWTFDSRARVFYIPSWWKWNPPSNANVLKGNLRDLMELPPCGLVEAFAQHLETLPHTLHQTFTEGCVIRLAKRSPTQEQDQDRKQNREPQSRVSIGNDGDGVPEELLTIARTTLQLTNAHAPIEELLDAFSQIARNSGHNNFTKTRAIRAINYALSEKRAAKIGT